MRYVQVKIHHQPDAGQASDTNCSYVEHLGHSDEVTARDFAYRALGEGDFRKGLLEVVFPQRATYSYRFERMGIMGYHLTEINGQEKREEARLA